MRFLKVVSVLVATFASGVTLYFAWPKLARDFPALKKLETRLRSASDSDRPVRPVVVVKSTSVRNLSPEEAQWLEVKRRRYQLLSEAVKP